MLAELRGRASRAARGLWRGPDGLTPPLQLEWRFSKKEILSIYLTLAPFGGNIEGVRAASLAWFGKEPGRLTPAEAALLVALPQSPERRRPDRYPDRAHAARDIVRSFYSGEAGKLILTAVLFALTFAGVKPLSAPALFGVYLLTLMVNAGAPLLLKKPTRP